MVFPITASGILLPDSLLTREHIYEYTFSDTAKAARIIDLMRERRLAPEHVLDIAESDLLFNNGRYNAALPFYKSALASDSIRNNDAICKPPARWTEAGTSPPTPRNCTG